MKMHEKMHNKDEYIKHLENIIKKVREYLRSSRTAYNDCEDSVGYCVSCGAPFSCKDTCEYAKLKKMVDDVLA